MSKIASVTLRLVPFLLLVGLSCSKRAEPPLPSEMFAQIYVDYLSARPNTVPPDSGATGLDKILAKYHVSRDAFERAKAFYDAHPEAWQDVLTLITQRLERRVKAAPSAKK